MRFAFLPFVALVGSFAFAATPTATIDASANYYKIDMTRPPPPPTPVYVVNFPDTQAVTGTVNVGNLPAVQSVGGTVNVGNLPLDADGAVRVTTACPTATPLQARYVDLIGGGTLTIAAGELYVSAPVSTAGYSHVGFLRESLQGQTVFEWSWVAEDEWFAQVLDSRNGTSAGQCESAGETPLRQVCVVSGSWVRIKIDNRDNSNPPRTINALGVYLMP